MSLTPWRLAVPFDPASGALPAELRELIEPAAATAPVVLLVAGPEARRSGWAPGAALALARAWDGVAPGVVLADLAVGAAHLHELAGVPNDEGLADVFLFGASIRHVRHRVPGEPFALIPAGVAPAEIETVLRHPRWQSVVAEFFRTEEALLVYVPAEAPGLDELARRIGCGLALVAPGDDWTLAAVFPEEFVVLHTLGAPEEQRAGAAGAAEPSEREAPVAAEISAESAEQPGPGAEVETEAEAGAARPDSHGALVDALWARRAGGAEAAREAAAVKPDVVAGRAVTEEELLDEPPPAEREPVGRRRGVSLLLWLALGAAVALGIVFGAQEYFGYDVLGRLSGGGDAPAESMAPLVRAAPPPHALARPLPYSVAIEARRSYASALARLGELEKVEPGMQFFVSPILAGNALYYRIMAGPVADSTAAAVLMQRLLDAGVKTGASQWDIRPTPWSFLLGEFASRDAAAAHADSLGTRNIPSYVVQVPYSAGPPRWRLYGGAFEGPAQAEALRPLLRGAGVPDTLVERTGRSES